jgi:uncharacterized protein (DUF58 family)
VATSPARAGLLGRLLDPAALARYDHLALHVRRGRGERPGDRRFPGRPEAAGIEVEAWKSYVPGDDLRHLDWNALGRLDTLLVRRFTAEREVLFHVLVDVSASMAVPARDRKLETALELAMALAYIALAGNDAVRLALLADDDGPARESPILRQRASVRVVAERLAAVAPGGAVGLGAALESYARRHPRPGAAVVVSDLMMEPGEVERGLHALRARRYDVLLLQVLGAGELDPAREFTHGILRDVESGATHPIRLTRAARARYTALLDAHLEALRGIAERTETPYARLVTGAAVDAFVTTELSRLGVVRRR